MSDPKDTGSGRSSRWPPMPGRLTGSTAEELLSFTKPTPHHIIEYVIGQVNSHRTNTPS
jgi:hypothetical protein